MARTKASTAPGAKERRRAARRDVLNNEALLERILSLGRLSAKDVASAALVCRLWSRVAAGDAVWRPVWLREARSMRNLEGRFAGPRGAGFRAAVAQLRAAALLAQEPKWRLADYTVSIDVTWRGNSLFSSAVSLDFLELDDDDGTGTLQSVSLLQPHESYGPLLFRALQNGALLPDVASRVQAVTAVSSRCSLRVLLCRTDGAVACLAGREPCKGIGNALSAAPPRRLLDVELNWELERGSPIALYGVDDDGSEIAFGLLWKVLLVGHTSEGYAAQAAAVALDAPSESDRSEDDDHAVKAPFSGCYLTFEAADTGAELPISPELLLSGLSTMKWVQPVGATAHAVAAKARQTAAELDEAAG